MIFPIIIPIYKMTKDMKREPKYDYKTAKQLHDDYKALMNNMFSKYNFCEWIGQINDDPFSPGLHYICITEERKFLKLFPYKRKVAIAEITSEPEFEEEFLETTNILCKGLEIRVIDKNIRPIIDELYKKYKSRFSEELKLT